MKIIKIIAKLLYPKPKTFENKFDEVKENDNNNLGDIYIDSDSNDDFVTKLLFFFFIFFLYLYLSLQKKYFACFCALAREENKYAKELISYYSKLGVNKFIFGDNNILNTEKLSDVLQDYIDNDLVDIYEFFDSDIGQSEFSQSIYEIYKKKCNWFLFFDFDEYLEIHNESNTNITLQKFLTQEVFDKCETILFNWVIYTDNNLIYYDNRTLIERFTEPYFDDSANIFVKSIVRGGLDKIIFYPNRSNHVPDKHVNICDSLGRIIERYNPFFVRPPKFNNGYIKHFSTKTAEEYALKMKRGQNRNLPYNLTNRIEVFFDHNKFSKKKLKYFQKYFNRTFKPSKRRKL